MGKKNVQDFVESDDFGVEIHVNDPGVTGGAHTYISVRDFHFASRSRVSLSQVAKLWILHVSRREKF
jgi:hypothetical protein